MKLIGMKRPRKKMNEARVRRLKRMSANGSRNTFRWNGRGRGGSRDLIVRAAIHSRPRSIKAIERMVQPKPMLGMRCEAMMGMMMPPRPLPAAIIP
jgi:hypothetical protein